MRIKKKMLAAVTHKHTTHTHTHTHTHTRCMWEKHRKREGERERVRENERKRETLKPRNCIVLTITWRNGLSEDSALSFSLSDCGRTSGIYYSRKLSTRKWITLSQFFSLFLSLDHTERQTGRQWCGILRVPPPAMRSLLTTSPHRPPLPPPLPFTATTIHYYSFTSANSTTTNSTTYYRIFLVSTTLAQFLAACSGVKLSPFAKLGSLNVSK